MDSSIYWGSAPDPIAGGSRRRGGIGRRGLLKVSALGSLSFALPAQAAAARGRVVVLLELSGGNDGLNTVVPYRDAAYQRARPRLAIPVDQVLRLNEHLGLAPSLEPLMSAWQEKDLAVALGVGYPRPNRSHFRGIEIWNQGSLRPGPGWVGQVLKPEAAVDALVLGGDAGPVDVPELATILLQRPREFLQQAEQVGEGEGAASNPALAHILKTQRRIHRASEAIRKAVMRAPRPQGDFGKSPIGRQLQQAARVLNTDLPVKVIKLKHGGFDTHANQQGKHARLLQQLGQGLAGFRASLKASGQWDRVLLMTYGEFGRRVGQNASGGTDHGTAAPHFLMGGRVKGGLYGAQPSLTDLQGGDLKHSLDFRRLYATAARFWGADLPGARPLACL